MSQSDAGKGDADHTTNHPSYEKNFQRMIGVCSECSNYLGDDCAVGQHCKLDKCYNPQWGKRK